MPNHNEEAERLHEREVKERRIQYELSHVRAKARELDRVEGERNLDIRRASREGASLREIGAAAGLNHETVRKIIAAGDGQV